MSDWSYRKSNVEYRDSKQPHIEEESKYKKKGKKKKNKKSGHKHKYVPAIYHRSYIKSITGERVPFDCCGSHCKICGRIKNMNYMWSNSEERINQFRKEYPNYIEVTLADDFDWFRDKFISI